MDLNNQTSAEQMNSVKKSFYPDVYQSSIFSIKGYIVTIVSSRPELSSDGSIIIRQTDGSNINIAIIRLNGVYR